jgi:4-hydroxythreonine-4-phosphate dehydrogenase
LEKAAKAMNVSPEFNIVGDDLAGLKDGALNLVHMDNVDMGAFEYGKISAMGGKAAFEYIEKSVALAMAGKVDALATTLINKKSLKAASVPYIGHTEILAGLTDSHDPLTMFQVHDLRVFFLTRHVSLFEACKLIKKERVMDYIRRCAAALRQLMGKNDMTMAIAGLNPHSGEHGLFGCKEDDEIVPAIEEAKKEGYKVDGPKPADSVFYFALHGAWDAVLSLYHDQGISRPRWSISSAPSRLPSGYLFCGLPWITERPLISREKAKLMRSAWSRPSGSRLCTRPISSPPSTKTSGR